VTPDQAFDPGIETGYLRRGRRLEPPPVELGARPFDPGPEIGFDERRAKRLRHRREREEEALREAEERRRLEAERVRREAEERERLEAERVRLEREQERERWTAEKRAQERAARRCQEAESRVRLEQREGKRRERTAPPEAATPAEAGIRVKRIEPSLARPTAKASAAIAVVWIAAALAGSALGLPLPFESASRTTGISLNASGAAGVAVDSGIAAALYRGPFHPVLGRYDYGEVGAEFGAGRGGRRHEGQDIFGKSGTPLVAVRDGFVVDRAKAVGAYSGGRGHYVAIYSPIENRSYVYLHLLRPPPVAKGDHVLAGQIIGLMGCTGSCYGTHLHFEVRKGRATFRSDTKAIDPASFLRGLPQAPARLTRP
jgi:murein DD-endopeptidase MepM/ murein hydrolase activator NlpD